MKIVPMCAKDAVGLQALTDAVADLLGTAQLDPSAAQLCSARQLAAATRARDALAEAIDSILSSEEIQRRYSQNCRQYIPQFEFEAVMQGYLQAIAFVTSGNK